jgi:1-phosphofructokinase
VIVTVTPNPSVDRTLAVSDLRRGAVLRCERNWHDASGKGVNVSLALLGNAHKTRAVLPAGGPDGARLLAMLQAEDLDYVSVPIRGEVRSNVSLLEPDGTVTKVNETGPTLSSDEVDALLRAALEAVNQGDWLAGCGSLSPGMSVDFYARLVDEGHRRGVRVGLDTSGLPMTKALPAHPDLVKPNAEELAEVTGMPVTSIGEAIAAARRLQDLGAGTVLASLGADGALLVEATRVIHGEAVVDKVKSAVGAGDSLFAGFLAAAGGAGEKALASGLGWAAAALRQPGTRMPTAADVSRSVVTIHDVVDHNRRLRGD